MKKWLCLLLAVLMLVCLCACGEKDDKDDKDSTSTTTLADDNGEGDDEGDDEESPTTTTTTAPRSEAEMIVGSWAGEMDATEMFNSMLSMMAGEMGDYFKLDKKVYLTVTQEFKADGTQKSGVDSDSVDKFIDDVLAAMKEGMLAYFEDLIEGQGLDMTVEELLDMQGVDMDAVLEQARENMPMDGFGASEGKYRIEDGKLYTSNSLDADIDESIYTTCVVTENTLTLTGMETGNSGLIVPEGTFPVVLTRK